jgi:hypothetical protein
MNGEALRDAGMEQVKRNTDPDWKTAYVMVADALMMSYAEGRLFTGTDVNEYVKSIIGEPHDPHAWSAMFHSFIRPYLKANLAVWDGFTKSKKPSHHARWTKQYRKV